MSKCETADGTTMCFTGGNNYGQFGLNCYDNLWSFTQCPNPLIKKVFMSDHHAIFTDALYENIWCAGNIRFEPLTDPQLINGSECRMVDYFSTRAIKIKQICASEKKTFFITDQRKLYAAIPLAQFDNYRSDYHQLGIEVIGDDPLYKPIVFVHSVKNVIDVKSGRDFCIALCEEHRVQNVQNILEHWSRHIIDIGHDIRELIVTFCRTKRVYSTTDNSGSGQPTNIGTNGWNEIETLANKNIIQIACGQSHSLFLEDNGVLWRCGMNMCGCLGVIGGDFASLANPEPMAYFVDNKIRICDIQCGAAHNLALDENGSVYAWGDNEFGMCGDTTQCTVYVPQLISFFKDKKVISIKCGNNHSYVKTVNNEHYLFGENRFNQCFKRMFTGDIKRIFTPHQITLDEYNMEVVDIIPGIDNTAFSCVTKSSHNTN